MRAVRSATAGNQHLFVCFFVFFFGFPLSERKRVAGDPGKNRAAKSQPVMKAERDESLARRRGV